MARKSLEIKEHFESRWSDGAELSGVQKRLGLSKEAMIGWLTAQCQRDSNEINIPDERIQDWGKYMAEQSTEFVNRVL